MPRFNKPATIARDSALISFAHDSEHKRFKRMSPTGETLYLAGSGAMAERLGMWVDRPDPMTERPFNTQGWDRYFMSATRRSTFRPIQNIRKASLSLQKNRRAWPLHYRPQRGQANARWVLFSSLILSTNAHALTCVVGSEGAWAGPASSAMGNRSRPLLVSKLRRVLQLASP
jgi:hypothetical protein